MALSKREKNSSTNSIRVSLSRSCGLFLRLMQLGTDGAKEKREKKKKEKINRVGKERGWDMEKLREGHNERLGYMVHHFASWGNSSALR